MLYVTYSVADWMKNVRSGCPTFHLTENKIKPSGGNGITKETYDVQEQYPAIGLEQSPTLIQHLAATSPLSAPFELLLLLWSIKLVTPQTRCLAAFLYMSRTTFWRVC